ncbi:DUF3352 domain-containing protein [Parathermosynechococcus lividus]|uniref:DUF3352 domain-containing protein n=1 Tax=Parathermosynechococcus lividus TaxID=33070 RepID=UPI000C178D02|nr:DUF3352 domain-containing protein [Thermostichus lividus]
MTTQSKPSVPRLQRHRSWVWGGVAVVVVGAGVAAAIFLWQQLSRRPVAAGMAIAPQNALFTLSLPTDPSPWQAVAQSNLLQRQPWLAPDYGPVSPRGVELAGADYLKEVRPFIGKQATLVMLPMTPETVQELPEPPFVWIVPTLNLPMGEQLLQRFMGSPLTEVNGIKIFSAKGVLPTAEQGAIALVNHADQSYIVWSRHQSALKEVITTAQANNGIATKSDYQHAIKDLPPRRPLVELYVNLPAFVASQSAAPDGALPNPPRDIEGLVAAVDMTPQDIDLQAVTWIPQDRQRLIQEGQSRELSRLVPDTTLAFYGAGSFQALWQNTPQGVQKAISDTVEDLTGLDWQSTFVPWMTGEFAAAFVPVPSLRNAPSLLFLSQTNDRPRAEAAFQELDQQIRDRLKWRIQQTSPAPQPMTTWSIPPGLPVAQHGWLSNNTLFLGLGPSLLADITPRPPRPLADSPLYRAVIPHPRGAQLYINLSDLSLFENSLLLPQLAPDVARSLQPFAALGVTTQVRNPQQTLYTVRIRLKDS